MHSLIIGVVLSNVSTVPEIS